MTRKQKNYKQCMSVYMDLLLSFGWQILLQHLIHHNTHQPVGRGGRREERERGGKSEINYACTDNRIFLVNKINITSLSL